MQTSLTWPRINLHYRVYMRLLCILLILDSFYLRIHHQQYGYKPQPLEAFFAVYAKHLESFPTDYERLLRPLSELLASKLFLPNTSLVKRRKTSLKKSNSLANIFKVLSAEHSEEKFSIESTRQDQISYCQKMMRDYQSDLPWNALIEPF